MSYYHFFTLKEDSQYYDKTIDELKIKLKAEQTSFFNQDYKSILKASMVRWYYDTEGDLTDRKNKIANFIFGIYYQTSQGEDYRLAIEAKEEEDGIIRNRPMSEYDMQDLIDNWKEKISDIIGDLLILTCIRFEADDKYSDTPKTTSEYLEYDYQNRIDEKLDYFIDEIYDYTFAKFVTENCNRITEDEKYKEENETNN